MTQPQPTPGPTTTDPDDEQGPDWTTLYRFYDADDQLLYVGITKDPVIRWANHSRTKFEWRQSVRATLEHFPSRKEAHEAEVAAIESELPLWNIQHNVGPLRPLRQIEVALELRQAAKQRLADGCWLSEAEVGHLFRASPTEVDKWLRVGVPLLKRPLRHRRAVGAEREANPEDVAELLLESRKWRDAEHPDGIPGQFVDW